MSTTINLLCPNSRRIQIKVQPNTKILDIIEEACKKQGFDSNEYCLIHQKKTLDITLSFRLSGIPNNGHLELRKLETGPRIFNDVTIVLQLDDGSRLSAKSFPPNSTYLEDILNAYKDESDLLHVAFNEQLALETETYPVFNYLNEQIIGLKQFKQTTLKDLGLINGRVIVRFGYKSIDRETYERSQMEFDQKINKKIKLDQEFIKIVETNQKLEATNQKMEANNSEYNIAEPKKVEQPSRNREVNIPSIRQAPVEVQRQRHGNISLEPEPVMQTNEFINFKFPEETKGMDLNLINELAVIEEQSKEACERLAALYSIEETTKIEAGDLPEDFYEVTAHDLRVMVSDLKRIQDEESTLMTKKMRELEQDKRAMKYSKVAIRICFKNKQTLQGLFRPKELVAALYKFVKESFSADNSKDDLDFYLYTTPPKMVLNEMKVNLFESKLCPAAFVYFKNKSDKVPTFNQNITTISFEKAQQLVFEHVHQAIRDIDHEGMDWLQNEQKVVQNIMRSSGIGSQQPSTSRPQSRLTSSSSSNMNPGVAPSSEANKKLQFFLKGSKK